MCSLQQAMCWICCVNPANSREHSFKKNLLNDITTTQDKRLVHFRLSSNTHNIAQSSGSDRFKYKPSICHDCNTAVTQAHDRAFDVLTDWYLKNADPNNSSVTLDLQEIYGADFVSAVENLQRFFAKSLGCRIREAGLDLSQDFPNPKTGANMDKLKISMCLAYPFGFEPDHAKLLETVLGNGDLLGTTQTAQGKKTVINAIWWQNIGSLQINYWYCKQPNEFFGSEFNYTHSQYVMQHINMQVPEIYSKMNEILVN